MTDFGPVCREHLEFMQWADDTTLSAFSAASPATLTEKRDSSFSSLFDTLNHIYLAELIWLRKVTGHPNVTLADLPAPADITALTAAWPAVHQEWMDFARPLSSNDWTGTLHFQTRHFGELDMPFWKIVFHVVNHGSYHRGQLATMMRQAGIAPPPLDLMLFYSRR